MSEHNGVVELEYSKATRAELWAAYKELRDAPEETTASLCQGECSQEAQKHLAYEKGWGFRLRPFGVKSIPYYVRGPVVKFCPFCGRSLSE